MDQTTGRDFRSQRQGRRLPSIFPLEGVELAKCNVCFGSIDDMI